MLIRFVIGVTPLLGFLGTVVHFGTALSGISMDQIADKLPEIVSEMGTAFNTTTVALGAAMSTTIALFVCERLERSIDHSVDRLVENELLHRFVTDDPSVIPYVSSVQSTAESVLRTIKDTVHRQTDVWSKALDVLCRQIDHRELEQSQGWKESLEELQKRHEEFDMRREDRLREILSLIEAAQSRHMTRIQSSWDQAASLREDFAELVQALQSLARGEGQLLETQAVLTDNLRVLRETQQIDEALHGLTAAIHLLTARYGKTDSDRSAAA